MPLQVAPSITDTVRSLRLPTRTVFLSRTMPTALGAVPTGTVATGTQPDVVMRLQVLPLMTETVLSFLFVT